MAIWRMLAAKYHSGVGVALLAHSNNGAQRINGVSAGGGSVAAHSIAVMARKQNIGINGKNDNSGVSAYKMAAYRDSMA